MADRRVEYSMRAESGREWSTGRQEAPRGLPVWTELDHHRCSGCPLEGERCPAAVAVVPVVEAMRDLKSFERVYVTVTSTERTTTKSTTAHEALRSLFGMMLAQSGCPVLAPLEPLAAHHLPFSTFEETLFRVCALFSLRAHFEGRDDWIDDVKSLYQALGALNRSFGARLRSACEGGDAGVNAVVNLFSLGVAVGSELDSDIEALRDLVQAGGRTLSP